MRNTIYLTTFILLFLSTSLNAQAQNDSLVNLEKTFFRLHFLPLGLGIENHLTKNATLLIDIGAGFSYQIIETYGNRDSDFKLIPFLAIEPRIYTNLQTRQVKGKRTDYRSGAYGAFRLQGGIDLENEDWYVQFGPLVGFQRTLGKKGYWNIGIGCGSTIVEEDVRFGLIGDLKLGFIINC
jgi:hypothetical protein